MLTPLQRQMKVEAQRMYPGKRIQIIGTKTSWEDCFVLHKGKMMFWFDTDDGSSHLLTEDKFYGGIGKMHHEVC